MPHPIEEFYKTLHLYLFKVANSYVQRPEIAEEIVQESFIRLLKKDNIRYENQSEVKELLRKTVKNVCIDVLRYKNKQHDTLDNVELQDHNPLPDEIVIAFQKFIQILKMLPPAEAEVMILIMEEVPQKEIAQRLKRPEGTVNRQAMVARQKIKNHYTAESDQSARSRSSEPRL